MWNHVSCYGYEISYLAIVHWYKINLDQWMNTASNKRVINSRTIIRIWRKNSFYSRMEQRSRLPMTLRNRCWVGLSDLIFTLKPGVRNHFENVHLCFGLCGSLQNWNTLLNVAKRRCTVIYSGSDAMSEVNDQKKTPRCYILLKVQLWI